MQQEKLLKDDIRSHIFRKKLGQQLRNLRAYTKETLIHLFQWKHVCLVVKVGCVFALACACASFLILRKVYPFAPYFWDMYEVYQKENMDEYVNTVAMKDVETIEYVRDHVFVAPPPSHVPLNLTRNNLEDSYFGQATFVKEKLKGMRNGFFIEVGAFDGETKSNTLALERHYNWTGLLIEPDPDNYQKLVYKRRKAILSPTCISTKPYSTMELYPKEKKSSMHQILKILLNQKEDPPINPQATAVECFPLYTYLKALNSTNIDYLSLNVNNDEFQVLESIPWEKVKIRIISVTQNFHFVESKTNVFSPLNNIPYHRTVLEKYIATKGYRIHREKSKSVFENTVTNFVMIWLF